MHGNLPREDISILHSPSSIIGCSTLPRRAVSRLALILVLFVAALLSGCQSDKPNSKLPASVEIHNRSLQEIMDTTRSVLVANGYHSMAPYEKLVFEKKGDTMDQVYWGGLLPDDAVFIRVRIDPQPVSESDYNLVCYAKAIRNAGEPAFEEEVPNKTLKRKPFQELLDQVAEKLK